MKMLTLYLRLLWAELRGDLIRALEIRKEILMAELVKTSALIATISAGTTRVIAQAQADASAAADAAQSIAGVDDTVAAQLQPIADQISAFSPPPPAAGDQSAS